LSAYQDKGYNHSGWLNGAGTHYAMCDETHGMRVKLVDVTDQTDLQVTSLFGTGIDGNSIVHNAIFTGNLLHTSYYHDGYWLWDHTDPINPVLLGYYDTSQEQHLTNFKGAWGVYPNLPSGIVLVSDMQEGLFILDVSQAVSVTETQQLVDPTIHIWPNPTQGSFQIRIPGAEQDEIELSVFNAIGEIVHNTQTRNKLVGGMAIDLEGLPSGLYAVQVSNGTNIWSSSIVKE